MDFLQFYRLHPCGAVLPHARQNHWHQVHGHPSPLCDRCPVQMQGRNIIGEELGSDNIDPLRYHEGRRLDLNFERFLQVPFMRK